MSENDEQVPSMVFNMKNNVHRGEKITINSVANTLESNKWKDPKRWPKTLHDFISRSFKEAGKKKFNDNEVRQFKSQLKNVINMAIKTNSIMRNDWTKQEIPLLVPGSQFKLGLYCDQESNSAIDRLTSKIQQPSKTVTKKRKNIFGEDESESDSDDNVVVNYKQNLSNKPTIALKDSLKRLKKQKVDHYSSPDKSSFANENPLSDKTKLNLRSKRFERELSEPAHSGYSEKQISTEPIVGKNTILEKKYLRLTSAPNPESVRPLEVLHQTLQLIFDKYFEGAKYSYLCDQCKSMRQDLTVQNIKKDFSIVAYEFHSKLAIENEDWGEFNQCQSQLKILYAIKDLNMPNYHEFLSYRVLYYILTSNYNEIFELELGLRNEGCNTKDNIFLNYALEIFQFIYNSDYYSLSKVVSEIFTLESLQETVAQSLNSNRRLLTSDTDALLLKHNNLYFFRKFLEVIMQRVNIQTLSVICKGYRQISVNYLIDIMSMKDTGALKFFLNDNNLGGFLTDETFNCVGARPTVENVRSKLFKKIDIKGQV